MMVTVFKLAFLFKIIITLNNLFLKSNFNSSKIFIIIKEISILDNFWDYRVIFKLFNQILLKFLSTL